MPIQYALFENNVTADPDDYAAFVQTTGTADFDLIAQRITAQGSVLSKADILALLESTVTASIDLLKEGYRVNFGGLCDLVPCIKGVFTGPADGYDPARHQIGVGGGPGSRVRAEVRKNASVEKVEAVKPAPNPVAYRDLQDGSENTNLTMNGIGTLIGHRLKVNTAAADEGLFLVNATTGADITRITAFQKNKPGELVWLNPSGLPDEPIRLEVRARMRPTGQLRTGALDSLLTKL